jgi:hypothetical protein
MNLRRLPRLDVRLTLGALAFALAALTLVWPIHIRAATGSSFNSKTGRVALSGFASQSCSWELQLGHVRNVTPPAPTYAGDLIGDYNDSLCTARRYDRTSEALLWVIIGTALTASGLRRRLRAHGLSPTLAVDTSPRTRAFGH